MARRWEQLPEDEWIALRSLVEAPHKPIGTRLYMSLVVRGLVEDRQGPATVSPAGKQLYDEWAMSMIVARRQRERDLYGR